MSLLFILTNSLSHRNLLLSISNNRPIASRVVKHSVTRNKPAALDILLILHLPELRPAQHFLEPTLRRDHDLPAVPRTRNVAGAEDLEETAGGDPLEKPVDDQLCEEGGYLGVSDGLGGPRGGVVDE